VCGWRSWLSLSAALSSLLTGAKRNSCWRAENKQRVIIHFSEERSAWLCGPCLPGGLLLRSMGPGFSAGMCVLDSFPNSLAGQQCWPRPSPHMGLEEEGLEGSCWLLSLWTLLSCLGYLPLHESWCPKIEPKAGKVT
jgi:hypothetical protein